jgi:hypothetical protein
VPISTSLLPPWRVIAASGHWDTLFLGNGASANVSQNFSYDYLFNQADLSVNAKKIFTEFKTTNFELALELLGDAQRVCTALGTPRSSSRLMAAEYANIREALFEALNRTHVGWDEIPESTRHHVADVLLGYRKVFTTNYDLLVYWSLLSRGHFAAFTDFFVRDDPSDPIIFDVTAQPSAARFRNKTQLYHLHGGLHLWRDSRTGATGKWDGIEGTDLVEIEGRFRTQPDRQPLLVSEGTATDKLRAIRSSDYLSFTLSQLSRDRGNMVIFGWSFGLQDQHITDAINNSFRRRIAISMRPSYTTKRMRREQADLVARLDRHDVVFFNAETHPIGDPTLAIEHHIA